MNRLTPTASFLTALFLLLAPCRLAAAGEAENTPPEELLPTTAFAPDTSGEKIQGWILQYNDNVKPDVVKDETTADNENVLSLTNPDRQKPITVSSATFHFSQPGRYLLSVYAKAMPDAKPLQLEQKNTPVSLKAFIISRDWKKAFHDNAERYNLAGEWAQYRFEYCVMADDLERTYSVRFDIAGAGTFLLKNPSLTLSQKPVAEQTAEPLRKIASINFDENTNAQTEAGEVVASQQENVSFAEGIRGQAVVVDDGGALVYPTETLVNASRGAISFWVKQDYDAQQTFADSDRIGIDVNGKDEQGKTALLMKCITSTPGVSFVISSSYGRLDSGYSRCRKLILKNEWRHYLFSWDSSSGIDVYLDGFRFLSTRDRIPAKRFATLNKLIPDTLKLFTATGKNENERACMDEVCFFNRAVTADEARALYREYVPTYPSLLDYAAETGKASDMRVQLLSPLAKDFSLKAVLETIAGDPLWQATIPVKGSDVKEGNDLQLALNLTLPEAVDYRLTFLSDQKRIKTFEITGIQKQSITDAMPVSDTGDVKLTLIDEIDCTKEYPDSRYVDDGNVMVNKNETGVFREAMGHEKNSGFAYNFNIPNPGKPYWIEIEYPDDKARTFYTAVEQELRGHGSEEAGNLYSQCGTVDTIGVTTGRNNPCTGTMRTKRLLFWPDAKRIMVGCFVYLPLIGQAGPALSKIRLYENDGPLPRLAVHTPTGLPARSVGSWNEDPSFPAGLWFRRSMENQVSTLDDWKERLKRQVEYLRFTGQNHTIIQTFTYSGDNRGIFGILPQNGLGSGYVPGWQSLSAQTLQREGIRFHVQINDGPTSKGLSRLIGEEHLSDDPLQAAERGEMAVEMFDRNGAFAKGRLNFLHPLVEQAHLKRLAAYRQEFCRLPNFDGILYFLSHCVTFRNAQCGYGDYTTLLFEEDTGVEIPVDPESSDRFQQRYDWLQENAWQKWLDWRCQKVVAFLKKATDVLNPDGGSRYKFVLPFYFTRTDFFPKNTIDNDPGGIDLRADFKAMGVDLAMLKENKAVVVEPVSDPLMARLYGAHRHYSENVDNLWYSDSFADLYKDLPASALMLSRPNMEVYGWEAPIKKYWWPMGYWGNNGRMMAFSSALPDNLYLPQTLAWTLAHCDIKTIDHGWWGNPENGGIDRFQKFYQAYRSIPAVPFDVVAGCTDPVMVRHYHVQKNEGDGGDWFYMVNLLHVPVTLELQIQTRGELLNATNGTTEKLDGNTLRKELQPYQVICYHGKSALTLKPLNTVVPDAFVQSLAKTNEHLKTGFRIFGNELQMKNVGSGLDDPLPAFALPLLETANQLMEQKRFAKLYYLQHSANARTLLDANERATDLSVSYAPGRNCLDVLVANNDDQELSGRLSLCPPFAEGVSAGEAVPFTVGAASRKTIPLPLHDFKMSAFSAANPVHFSIDVDLGSEHRVLQATWMPVLAEHSKTVSIDGDLSEWQGSHWNNLVACPISINFKNGLKCIEPKFRGKYATRWNPEALLLAIKIHDQNLLQSPADDAAWKYDSVEIMIDAEGDAPQTQANLDANDSLFIVYANSTGAVVDDVTPAIAGRTPPSAKPVAKISRHDGVTTYEISLPAESIEKLRLLPEDTLSIALKVNNRDHVRADLDSWSIMTSTPEYPCGRPDRWNKLFLAAGSTDSENRLRAETGQWLCQTMANDLVGGAQTWRDVYDLPADNPARFALNNIATRDLWRAFSIVRGEWPSDALTWREELGRLQRLQQQISQGLQWPIKTPPSFPLPHAVEKPVIDGVINENVWKSALTFRNEYRIDSTQPQNSSAVWKMMWDQDFLYVAAELPDQDIVREKEMPYLGDSVELFLMPSMHQKQYWEIIVGAGGNLYDGLQTNNRWGGWASRPEESVSGLKYKAVKTENGYAVEMAVPFNQVPNYVLGNKAESGQTLFFALVRTNRNRWSKSVIYTSAFPLLYGGHNIFGHAKLTLAESK